MSSPRGESPIARRASFGDITEVNPLPRPGDGKVEEDGDATKAVQTRKLYELMSSYLSNDVHTIQRAIVNHVEYTLASNRFEFDHKKAYRATAHSVRDRLIESWNDTNAFFVHKDVKRVSYLSLEYLMGRSMQNALLNMDLETNYRAALTELGYSLEKLYSNEDDAALGNGGLGRLAACFLDSMATLDLPAWGYGIRYNYGIFRQVIRDGAQCEVPDYWLTFGNPWEIERPDVAYPVRFYGSVKEVTLADGTKRKSWVGGEVVQAVAYDNPIPGFDTYNTINLRLWKAAPSNEFDLSSFNSGDYMKAVEQRQRAETITHVLYPSDKTYNGKELRLKQQYFFVSATLQDVIRRFKKRSRPWSEFAEKNAIQLNDTHPSIGIPELMRILVDEEGVAWDDAWKITVATFSYTNHTILPEALEKWDVGMMGSLLPRHLEIIYDINWIFLQEVQLRYPGDFEMLRAVSIVEEGYTKFIRMAKLSIVGSHTVNGVAAIHSELIKTHVFPKMFELYPERFQNKTNGVTPRRWMNQCNPKLSELITCTLDTQDWLKDLTLLTGLRPSAANKEFQAEWAAVKAHNKARLARLVKTTNGVDVNPAALFDVQVKRIHEYKRQLMNCLWCIHRYQTLKAMTPEQRAKVVPRVVFIGGKAAPGYDVAKRIIRLINAVGAVVNADPDTSDMFKLLFIPNYNVSAAEIIIPASDLSQHISTAGMEASGTSNMKFAMNGGLIIGTMDGANIEIAAEIGEENMFIFGALTEQVPKLRMELRYGRGGESSPLLAPVLAALRSGKFGSEELVGPILRNLAPENDYYLVTSDFASYCEAQIAVDECYKNQAEWTRRSILSTAGMGKFSTDRTIAEYARDIWGLEPARRPKPGTSDDPDASGMSRVRSFPNFDPNPLINATGSGSGAGAGAGAGSK